LAGTSKFISPLKPAVPAGNSRRQAAPFTEAEAWRDVGKGWQPLFGSFHGAGYSIEWHDLFFCEARIRLGGQFSSRLR